VRAANWPFQSPSDAWNKMEEKEGGKFKPFLPLIIVGNVRSLVDKMDDDNTAGISGRQYYFFHLDIAT